MNQHNSGGENFQTKTGKDNTNFFGGVHHHGSKPEKLAPLYDIPSDLGSENFVGREEDLAHLHELLQGSERVAIAAATGMGGVGKTELAWQYAVIHRDLGSYPAGIWWLYVREQNLAVQVLGKAQRMQMKLPEGLDGEALVQACYEHWAKTTEGDGLLVLDDLPDYASVRELLPQNPRLKVLMTSRVEFGSPVRCLALKVLKPEKALELLQKIVGPERTGAELAEAEALCSWLGYLPLGIELVGRYLTAKPDLSLSEMRQRLEQQKLDARALKLPEELQGKARPYENLNAAFELSWQTLPEAAQRLACCLSLFALAPIDWSLVQSCLHDCDPEILEDLRDDWLIKLHLLERTQANTYQLHQLLRQFFTARCANRTDITTLQTAFAATLTEVAKTILRTVTLSDITRVKEAIPHLEVATHHAIHLPEADQITPFTRLAWFYHEQSLWQAAEKWYRICLTYTEQKFGANHLDVATSLNNLAVFYCDQGLYSEAEPLHIRALEIREQKLGTNHPDVGTSLSNLANLYCAQGRYSEAEPLYIRDLKIIEQQLGANHLYVATGLHSLANLYVAQGRYGKAEPLHLKALKIMEQQLEPEHPFVASCFSSLAILYDHQGRYSEAESLHLKALKIREQQLGADHLDVAISLNNLASVYESQGRYAEAEPLFLKALNMKEQQLGADHLSIAISLNNLASLYESQGRYAEAELLYLRALDTLERQLGAEHPDVATSLNNLAELYRAQGRYGEAEPLYLRALDIWERQLGAGHPSIATSLNNLANMYKSQGRYAEAEARHLRALNILEQQLGADHPNIASSLNNLAVLYYYTQRIDRAESSMKRALEIFQRVLGDQHPYTIKSRESMENIRAARQQG